MSTADLAEPLRTALIGDAGIVALLATFSGAPAVFTRRPAPGDAVYPMIVVTGDLGVLNEDGISDYRPIITRHIDVFAANDTPAHYRLADDIAYLVRTLFHHKKHSITVLGWNVVDIIVNGPEAIFTDDQIECRELSLEVRLAKLR